MGEVVTKRLSEMIFSWHMNDEIELAMEKYREMHSRQKEQEAQRPQDKFSNCEKKEDG